MRKLYFLLPGTDGKFRCGGLWAELKTLKIAQQICEATIVTYQQREKDHLFLGDLLQNFFPEDEPDSPDNVGHRNNFIFVISWGFHVPNLVRKLRSYPLVYHAHSAGYGFRVPAEVPILTVSRNTLGYWGQHAPNNLLYYLPNQISDEFCNQNCDRDIDVLVQARKSSEYLLQQLVPALKPHCRVHLLEGYVEDLAGLFNRSKLYLYDSAEYWAQQGVSEGFGLQPLEALACGCQVFSSVNGGLSDYLDPGFNCQKISGYSTDYDRHRILNTLQFQPNHALSEAILAEHRTETIRQRLQVILREINAFFDYRQQYHPGKNNQGQNDLGHDNPGHDNPGHDNREHDNRGYDNQGQNNRGQCRSDIPVLTRSRLFFLFTKRVIQKLKSKF